MNAGTKKTSSVSGTDAASGPASCALAMMPRPSRSHWMAEPVEKMAPSKAKSVRETCADIVAKHGGEVPRDLDQLTALRGVGRKTANVVLGNAYGIPSGIVVDTHVGRLSQRLGLTAEEDPVKIEFALQPLVPRESWVLFSHWLILHGRAICNARKPRCSQCPLAPHCPRVGVTLSQ